MPVDILKHLGTCLKQERKKKHLTQEFLSEKTGISVRHIAKIEKGVMNPSFEVLYSLVDELNLAVEPLFHSDMEPNDIQLQTLIHLYVGCSDQ